MSNFMENLKSEVKSRDDAQLQYTENGALGYATSGKDLVDINFKVTSYRSDSSFLIRDFEKAFHHNKNLAVKWLFYARDAREGLGERNLFQKVFSYLIGTHRSGYLASLIKLIPEYGRWKDVFDIYPAIKDTQYEDLVIGMIKTQLEQDLVGILHDKPISLLAKWAPRENCSSQGRRQLARHIMAKLGMNPTRYRKTLAKLNKALKTTEIDLSSKNFGGINYEAVPSLANLKYKNAFLRNDETRRREYLGKLAKGEAKMNMAVAFPHEIVHAYRKSQRFQGQFGWGHGSTSFQIDEALEGAWKNLPSFELQNTIVVSDSSGSMTASVGNTDLQAIEVAHALGIYCGDHNTGPFKNKMITFSESPKYLEWKEDDTLAAKLSIAFNHSEVANTNIEKVFQLILNTAIKNHCKQEEIPGTILIISDCEFDEQTSGRTDQTLFGNLAKRYEVAGYKLPRLAFINLCSRSKTIPIQENENGVILMSGFSVQMVKMLYSGKTDPYEVLCETLNSERYKPIIWE